MSDVDRYIKKREKLSKNFSRDLELGYKEFKIGLLLRIAREDAGITQEQIAQKLHTKKSAISRMENHAEDVKLSTIERFAQAIGKEVRLQLV